MKEAARAGIPLSDEIPWEAWKALLTAHIRSLVERRQEELMALLYRVDVSEEKLTRTLHEQAARPAEELIAALVIERVREKLEMKKRFSHPPRKDSDGEERW